MADNKYLIRKSYFDIANSRKDNNHQLGYDYREDLMNNSLSNYMFSGKNIGIIKQFNDLSVYLIDAAKNVKKTFNFATDRNSRNIN